MKETRKQIAANVRNELVKQYKNKLEAVEQKYNSYSERNIGLLKENDKLRAANDKLQEENVRLKDWIERLLDFANMPEDERQKFIEDKKREEDKKNNPFDDSLFYEFINKSNFLKGFSLIV